MNPIVPDKSTIFSDTLTHLLDELGDECERVLRLLAQLHTGRLSTEQIEDILADLTASVIHLHLHTKDMPEVITRELEQLPE